MKSATSLGPDETNRTPDGRPIVRLIGYTGGLLATVLVATLLAVALAGITRSPGGSLLVAAGCLAIVSVSPTVAMTGARWLALVELGRRSPDAITDSRRKLVRASGSRGSRDAYLATDDGGTP